MKRLLIAILLLLTFNSHSQSNYFSVTTDLGYNPVPGNISNLTASVKLPIGEFITLNINDNFGISILRFDQFGSLIETNEIINSSCFFFSVHTVETINNTLFFTGLCKIGSATSPPKFYLGKIDLIGGECDLRYRNIVSVSYTSGPSLILDSTNLYVTYPEGEYYSIAKYDHSLNEIWAKSSVISSSTSKNPSTDLIRTTDSTIILIGKSGSSLGLIKYDTTGILDSVFLFDNDLLYIRIYDVNESIDGSLIMCGVTYDAPFSKPIIIKMSKSGHVYWAKKLPIASGLLDFSGFVKVLELPNNNIIAFAYLMEDPTNTFADGLVCFDSNGNQLYSSYFGNYDPISYRLYDFKTYDNGILFSGKKVIMDSVNTYYYNYFGFADFNFENICEVTQFNLPFEDCLISNCSIIPTSSIISGNDISGLNFNLGNYSSSVNPLTEYCVTTGEISPINHESEVIVFPNPAIEGGIIKIKAPNFGNFVISVFDILGKEVYKGLIESEESSFFIGFPAGIYMLDIVLNNGIKFTEKIVINKK